MKTRKRNKISTAYKVVAVGKNFYNDVVYSSCIATTLPRCVFYSVERWAKANPGQNKFLFVFSTLGAARKFRTKEQLGHCAHIFRCKVKNFRTTEMYPRGTQFADAVKLIERV